MGNINESINKGIPIRINIPLMYNDLIKIINKDDLDKITGIEFEKFMTFVGNLCGSREDIEFLRTMEIDMNPETLQREIKLSYSGLISTLYLNLNIDNVCKNYKGVRFDESLKFKDLIQNTSDKSIDRLNILKKINNPAKLQKEFPTLYKKYRDFAEMGKNMKLINEYMNNKSIPFLTKMQMRKNIFGNIPKEEIDKMLNRDYSFKGFIESYSNFMYEFVCHIGEIIEYINQNPIDLSNLKKVDQEKLDLYVANQFLSLAEETKDEKSKQKLTYYVSAYFFEDKDRQREENPKILVGEVDNKSVYDKKINGKTVTPKKLYERFKNLLINNPKIKIVNLDSKFFDSLTLEEREEFMEEYLKDIEGNWELIPKDSVDFIDKLYDRLKNSEIGKTEEEKERHKERLAELYMEKKEFYDSTDSFYRILGKNTFDGYVGYIYTNGVVVLDKYFDNADTGKLADGHAIYIMNIEDFYTLSNLSKNTLIKNRLCKRFIHRGNWQDRVLKEINKKYSDKTAETIDGLVKSKKIVIPE